MINILNMDYRLNLPWCIDTYRKYINKDDKVVIPAFSYREDEIHSLEEWNHYYGKDDGIYRNGMIDSFSAFGVEESNIRIINSYTDSIETMQKEIASSDILYLPGGMPTLLYSRMKELELVEVIKNYQGVVIGCSAGAMVQFDQYYISPDYEYPNYSEEEGFGLLSGFAIEAHYHKDSVAQNESIKKYQDQYLVNVFGIGDQGMLVIEDNQVMSFGDVTMFLVRDNR